MEPSRARACFVTVVVALDAAAVPAMWAVVGGAAATCVASAAANATLIQPFLSNVLSVLIWSPDISRFWVGSTLTHESEDTARERSIACDACSALAVLQAGGLRSGY